MQDKTPTLFLRVIKDISTGIDGATYNNIKIGTNLAVLVILLIAILQVFLIPATDLKDYPWEGIALALGGVLFGGAGGEAVKQMSKTEPKE